MGTEGSIEKFKTLRLKRNECNYNLSNFVQGVPIRIEVGPRDLKEDQYVAVQRHNGAKGTYKKATLERDINNLLDDIHAAMYQK